MIKERISLALLTYVGKEFQSFAARNENDLWHQSWLKLCSIKSLPDPPKLFILQNSYVDKNNRGSRT